MNHRLWIAALLISISPAVAAPQQSADQAAGFDVFASSDADHTDVLKLGLSFYFDYMDTEHYQGVRLETFRFSSRGTAETYEERGYFDFAGTGARWKWNGTVGIDGRTLLGSGSIYNEEPFRQEYFVSRDLVETAVGIRRHLYYTFAGGTYEVPLDDQNTITAVLGVQKFDGDNYRIHLRGNYIYVVQPDWGLSLQLRNRYFWNSNPHEFDYFSPEWYFQSVPTIQLRRFSSRWQYLAALGWGVRRDKDTGWRSVWLADVSIISPKFGRDWYLKTAFTYSNMPAVSGYGYDYEQATLSLIKRF